MEVLVPILLLGNEFSGSKVGGGWLWEKKKQERRKRKGGKMAWHL